MSERIKLPGLPLPTFMGRTLFWPYTLGCACEDCQMGRNRESHLDSWALDHLIELYAVRSRQTIEERPHREHDLQAIRNVIQRKSADLAMLLDYLANPSENASEAKAMLDVLAIAPKR